jgi:hypothetical protein
VSLTPIAQRLANQGITRMRHRHPADAVQWLGAVQAQEYQPAKWALGLRTRGATDGSIERAFEDGQILRTHVMRPTWHFVAAEDLRWMQRLTGPRLHRGIATYRRQLQLEPSMLRRALGMIERWLGDGGCLTRAEIAERLRRAGTTLSGVRLAHALMYGELEAVICSGPRRGKQFTYGLVAARARKSRELSGDAALAELTRRYFRSHGPASVRDFVWWSGLATADARRGLDLIGAKSRDADGCTYWTIGSTASSRSSAAVHLLPIYDEYLVAYRDRLLVPHGPPSIAVRPGHSVTFQHALIAGGRVAGTWRVQHGARAVSIAVTPMRRLTAAERRGVTAAAERYVRFLGSDRDHSLTIGP